MDFPRSYFYGELDRSASLRPRLFTLNEVIMRLSVVKTDFSFFVICDVAYFNDGAI